MAWICEEIAQRRPALVLALLPALVLARRGAGLSPRRSGPYRCTAPRAKPLVLALLPALLPARRGVRLSPRQSGPYRWRYAAPSAKPLLLALLPTLLSARRGAWLYPCRSGPHCCMQRVARPCTRRVAQLYHWVRGTKRRTTHCPGVGTECPILASRWRRWRMGCYCWQLLLFAVVPCHKGKVQVQWYC